MQKSLLNFFSSQNKAKPLSASNQALKEKELNTSVDNEDDSGEIVKPKGKKRVLLLDSDEEENVKPVSKLKKFIENSENHERSMNVTKDLNNTTINETAMNFSVVNIDPNKREAFTHESLEFLKPESIRDKDKRRPDDPDYNPSTLYVPKEYLSKVTPGLRQWWIMKSDHYDTVLCFKVGKFYELYHMDAVIGVKVLQIAFMKGDYAHCGFPEKAFSRFAHSLVAKGYKVARVEQTERPNAKADKVVKREICQILTPGTYIDDLREDMITSMEVEVSDEPSLLAIFNNEESPGGHRIGYSYLIPRTGTILFGTFLEDQYTSKIKTLITHANPKQILLNKKKHSKSLTKIIDNSVHNCSIEYLLDETQFPTAKDTIKSLDIYNYFSKLEDNEDVDKSKPYYDHKRKFPTSLYNILDSSDNTGFSVLEEYEGSIRCLGAIVFYLRECLIDQEILSLGNISLDSPSFCSMQFVLSQRYMIIDSLTIKNLDLLQNSANNGLEGTLLEKLSLCATPMGKRMIKKWIHSPLFQIDDIKLRQEAVDDFLNLDSITNTEIFSRLRKLPDIERLLTKVHIMGVNGSSKDHPENRAVLFDELVYSKKKISDFTKAITCFKDLNKIILWLRTLDFNSKVIFNLIKSEKDGGSIPDMDEILEKFLNKFDHEKARQEGRIYPEPGLDEEYDQKLAAVTDIENELELFLQECSKQIGCSLKYVGNGKNRYQIEVPDHLLKKVPISWELSGQRKGFRRYKTAASIKLFEKLNRAEESKDDSLVSIMRRIFADFSSNYQVLHKAIENIIEFDCLYALAMFSRNLDQRSCFPTLLEHSENQPPVLSIKDGYHPSLVLTNSEIVPNDILLNTRDNPKSCYVVTGPNMGGKSTLMRQAALLSILAQMGCKVPASEFTLTPIDRIFTRIGASDKILAGESTFLVEMNETSYMLKNSSPLSLLLIDELGRGTSTFDGAAIACAVLKFLCKNKTTSPRTIFSTHYHNMLEKLIHDHLLMNNISVGHMSCRSKEINLDSFASEESVKIEKVTFLYKLSEGICPKSYGFNVALMAKLPSQIISNAIKKAKELDEAIECITLIKSSLKIH